MKNTTSLASICLFMLLVTSAPTFGKGDPKDILLFKLAQDSAQTTLLLKKRRDMQQSLDKMNQEVEEEGLKYKALRNTLYRSIGRLYTLASPDIRQGNSPLPQKLHSLREALVIRTLVPHLKKEQAKHQQILSDAQGMSLLFQEQAENEPLPVIKEQEKGQIRKDWPGVDKLSLALMIPAPHGTLKGPQKLDPKNPSKVNIQMETPLGSQVLAPASGTIAFNKPYLSYGNVVIVDHSEGYHSVLMGLGSVVVSQNQTVDKGDLLGFMPLEGPSTLTFEVRRNSTIEDPRPYIARDILSERPS